MLRKTVSAAHGMRIPSYGSAELPHEGSFASWLYEYGTHFAFPESMLKKVLPVGSSLLVRIMFRAGKEHPKECRETRVDIDRRLQKAMREW